MAQKRTPKQQGKIIVPAGVLPEQHELETASFLAELGKDIEFQIPNRTKGAKTPDILMDGVLWEMKTIFGKSKKTIQTALDRAGKQSKNVIIALRHTSMKTDYCLNVLQVEFEKRSLKRIIIITKSETDNPVVLER